MWEDGARKVGDVEADGFGWSTSSCLARKLRISRFNGGAGQRCDWPYGHYEITYCPQTGVRIWRHQWLLCWRENWHISKLTNERRTRNSWDLWDQIWSWYWPSFEKVHGPYSSTCNWYPLPALIQIQSVQKRTTIHKQVLRRRNLFLERSLNPLQRSLGLDRNKTKGRWRKNRSDETGRLFDNAKRQHHETWSISVPPRQNRSSENGSYISTRGFILPYLPQLELQGSPWGIQEWFVIWDW